MARGREWELGQSFPGPSRWVWVTGAVWLATSPLGAQDARSIVLQDDSGRPVVGMPVQVSRDRPAGAHCDHLLRGDSLATAITDGAGRVSIPAWDSAYALALLGDGYVFAERREADFPRRRLVRPLPKGETRISLHRLRTVRVVLRVTERGSPAAGLTLLAEAADCQGGVCSACAGVYGPWRTDRAGVLVLGDFRPEAYRRVGLMDRASRVRWAGDPRDWLAGDTIALTLSAGGVDW